MVPYYGWSAQHTRQDNRSLEEIVADYDKRDWVFYKVIDNATKELIYTNFKEE